MFQIVIWRGWVSKNLFDPLFLIIISYDVFGATSKIFG